MKAHIFKSQDNNQYHIIVEPDGLLEELAVAALNEMQRKGYADVVIDVGGLGLFVAFKGEK